ncbi:MAG: ATPase, partial [Rickettsiales bacterium]
MFLILKTYFLQEDISNEAFNMKRANYLVKLKKILLLILAILIYSNSSANTFLSKIILTDSSQPKLIGTQVSILEDKSNSLTYEKILNSSDFLSSNTLVPNLGVTNNTYWIKFSITNTSKHSELILEVAQPTLENIELYTPINDRKYIKMALGINKKYNKRFYDNQNYLFKINLAPNSTKTFFLKLNSRDQVMLPIYLGTSQVILESLTKRDLIFGLFLGTLITMLLYNLFIYYSVSDKIYLYYVFYILLIILVQGSLQGYTFRFVWPQYFLLEKLSIFIFPAIADIGVIVFSMVFLNTKNLLPNYHSLLKIFIVILSISVILALVKLYNASFNAMQLSTIFASFTLLFISIKLVNQGYRAARFFLISWSFLLTGAIIFVLKDFGILPYNLFTSYSLEIGSALEVLLLSFALADKINIYKKEKEVSQAATLS